ncbi:Uncharacterised protein [Clostridioides difficile]|nr:Uncharacterised protein [Clostridioides difficile]
MRTLLSLLNLDNKLIINENMIENAFTEIDYQEVDKKLQNLRSDSIKFLEVAIVGE